MSSGGSAMDVDVIDPDAVRVAAISAAEARRQKILARSKDRLSKITYGISSLTTEETPSAPVTVTNANSQSSDIPLVQQQQQQQDEQQEQALQQAHQQAPQQAHQQQQQQQQQLVHQQAMLFQQLQLQQPQQPFQTPTNPMDSSNQDQTMAAMQQLISQFAASGLFPSGPPGSQPDISSLLSSLQLPSNAQSTSAVASGSAPDTNHSHTQLLHNLLSPTMQASNPFFPTVASNASLVSSGSRSSLATSSAGAAVAAGAAAAAAGTLPAMAFPAPRDAATTSRVAGTVAALFAIIIQLFGSSMQEAVLRTTLLRCLLAISLAVCLSLRLLDTTTLPASPLVMLACCQALIVFIARLFLRSAPKDADKAGEAQTVPLKFRSLDFTQLVPGLRPLLTTVYSMRSFAVSLYDGAAVFVVSCALIQCVQQLRMIGLEDGSWGTEPRGFKWLLDDSNLE